jgi:hypothetical protein
LVPNTYHNAPIVAGVDIKFQLFDKTATRLAEAVSVLFQVAPQDRHVWRLSKMGEQIDPTNVVTNGSQYVHGEWRGL